MIFLFFVTPAPSHNSWPLSHQVCILFFPRLLPRNDLLKNAATNVVVEKENVLMKCGLTQEQREVLLNRMSYLYNSTKHCRKDNGNRLLRMMSHHPSCPRSPELGEILVLIFTPVLAHL